MSPASAGRATEQADSRPRMFLEETCPVAELSVEAQRERGASSSLPPLYFLHVWWARRPLTVSRAAVLGSLLPADFPREDFLELMGIPRGADPVADRDRIDEANKAGVKLDKAYSYKRAYTNPIPPRALEKMRKALKETWGTETPTVLDSFAGGGSIPFEAVRLGLPVIMNELNPVASVIERATIEYPARFGPDLAEEIDAWGNRIADHVEEQLADCFPKQPGEEIFAYIWVRTVTCPQCSLAVPLSPNWWLDKPGRLGYHVVVPKAGDGNDCTFRIEKAGSGFDPDEGTVTRGVGTCPRCAAAIEGDYIKTEAQAGRMGHQLAAVGFKMAGKKGRHFRAVQDEDLLGVRRAESLLAKRLPEWEAKGWVPNEKRYIGPADRSANYGIVTMRDMFSPRQLLVHMTTLEAILTQPWEEVKDPKRREAVRTCLALALDKTLDYNSLQSRLHVTRGVMVNTFDRHDFSFKWSYGEIDGAGQLYAFGVSQVADAFGGIAKLMNGQKVDATYLVSDATDLAGVSSGAVHAVSIDPPYYDNVMYSECSDFFYVWMKRSLGGVFPDLFAAELTDKDREAVANVARFKDTGRGKGRGLADEDYTAKMRAAFAECHRVLREDGVLTIMFTHKRVEAWDSLGRALIEAGFEITATWPVHTESEHSLHQARKNAAASTILLVCRKRTGSGEPAWWQDLEPELRANVRASAGTFAAEGLRGQDVSIACFGPALQILSRQWPVRRKDGSTINPDEALDLARAEVSDWFFEQIAAGRARTADKWTRFCVLAWYVFRAREFPFDEARKLALAVKADIDELVSRKVLGKKGNNVRLLPPAERFRKGALDPADEEYPWDLDYVHAAIHAYERGQSKELDRFHQRTEALKRDGYRNAIAYLLDVLPRTKEVTEYHTLDRLWEANLQDRVTRKRPRTTDPTFEKQQRLTGYAGEGEDEEGDPSEGSELA